MAHDDPSIKGLTASSWIVAKNPGILELLGFTILGPIDEEMKKKHFSEETRPIDHAIISRDELLKKYYEVG
jgi:hypothetical protein